MLFRPKAALKSEERALLVDEFTRALRQMSCIQRFRIGKRVRTGRSYEQLMSEDYTYAAIIEFDDRKAFEVYLDHPAHVGLATRFFVSFETVLIYDYEMSVDPTTFL